MSSVWLIIAVVVAATAGFAAGQGNIFGFIAFGFGAVFATIKEITQGVV